MSNDRREQILKAAAHLFARQGYHVTTVSDIAKEAQVAQGTVYLYFESKKAVFEALVDETLDLFKSVLSWGSAHISAPDVAERLPGIFRRVLGLLAENRILVRLMLTEVRGADPQIEAKLLAFYKDVVARIAEQLRRGAERGVLRANLNPELAAHSLIAVMERMAALIISEEEPDLDSMADEIARLQLCGILAQPALARF
ncbi:MAG: TetR/AcrR family transcriptional regulator [Firmicutes bacterium]|nr:TetR/AcrR family transcriptional regulator [Bacillota bacterium]